MPKGRVRNMFPGGNTSKGFFSFYRYIISEDDSKRVFIMKGGPGVGKSSFMKRVSDEMVERGYDVEHMHCSSDNSSLDGVVIPQAGIALIDGTAPHVVDPGSPGVVDEIINLGDFWDEAALVKSRQKVISLKNEISVYFTRAYRYLAAAACINQDSVAITGAAVDEARVNILATELKNELLEGIPLSSSKGRERCLFASAITPDGLVNYLDDLMIADNIYMLKGFAGAGTEQVLEKLKSEAQDRGLRVEAYYCAFDPAKLEHLILPGLNTAFTTVNKYHTTDACPLRKIDFAEFINRTPNLFGRLYSERRSELEYNQSQFDILINKAVDLIHSAKALHDELETCYIPAMDFEAVEGKWEITMKRILDYATQ
ncbi:MAG: ATPase [Clostridia bacterium]|nr:ATPase [Clostridia bacterium]